MPNNMRGIDENEDKDNGTDKHTVGKRSFFSWLASFFQKGSEIHSNLCRLLNQGL